MKMLHPLLIAISAVALLAGCGEKSTSQAQGTPSTNPADITNNTLVNAKRTADKTIDVSFLNQAIQLFNVQEGRYPKNLQELVPNYVAKIPDAPPGFKIVYDVTSGTVKVVQQP